MKKLLMICLAAAMTGCGIYKSYERPEIVTDGLYGAVEASDASLGDLACCSGSSSRRWRTTPTFSRPIGA